jgi:hypothetical protein
MGRGQRTAARKKTTCSLEAETQMKEDEIMIVKLVFVDWIVPYVYPDWGRLALTRVQDELHPLPEYSAL